MNRYTFDFISTYGGQSDYRIWRNGKDGGRLCVKGGECFYADGSGAIRAEVEAFNEFQAGEHARAVAKYGPEFVDPWTPFVARALRHEG